MNRAEIIERIEQAEREGATSLDLSKKGITDLPGEIGQLTNLSVLQLHGNRLSTLSPEIGRLTSLQVLDLSNNRLRELPMEIGRLTRLRKLFLWANDLEELPKSIGDLVTLLELYLGFPNSSWGNPLVDLPEEITNLTSLTNLLLHSCQQLDLPPEIIQKSNRPKDILDYYFRSRERPTKALNEAKVLVVGEAEVGKTSLIKQLLGKGRFDPKEDQTHGIVKHRWDLDVSDDRNVRLNVWDFGGQEIMHATHQFFLTRRSLYMLVVDSRQNERQSRIEYWLKLIHSFGEDSPIIVVCNKCDQQQMELDWAGLQTKYPQIKCFIRRVSCYHDEATGENRSEGLDDVRQAIVDQIARLEHVDTPFPQTWFDIKQQLEDMPDSFKPYTDYRELCEKKEITDESEQKQLIGFLHDLGIVLHFHDHPLLKDTNVLNPLWVTNAVYRILNCNELFQSKGELLFNELSTLLKTIETKQFKYPEERQLFLVEMMRRFELCFDFEGRPNEKFLIPGLLPLEAPDTGDWSDAIGFQYRYEVLPQSVMSRFIVRMHKRISEHTYWRKGVVLVSQDRRNRALVKADMEELQIDIRVDGPVSGRRALLSSIRDQFAEIHASIPRLGEKEFVPVPGHPEAAISYQRLLDLEELDEETDYVEEIRQKINVEELLDGVSEFGSRQVERDRYHIDRAREKYITIHAGNGAKIAVNEGNVTGDIQSGGTAPGQSPDGVLTAFSAWRKFSIACGIGAVIIAVILWLIPSNEWRAGIGGLIGLGIGVTAFMMSMDPAFFYRRLLCYVIPVGLLINAIGFSVDAFVTSEWIKGWFEWDGTVSGIFFVAWAAVIAALVWGDTRTQR